ncbi:thioredoxin TrxC [Gynuella sp.]|uniref:thioredoxin TrxC n=1 Tax=Gynuella sp. TaxID=2969146 RepID=UPI003D0ADDF2
MNLICPHCFTLNRIPIDKSYASGKCGKCHQTLHTGHPVTLNDQNLESYLAKNSLPVIVDFWAEWCGPCKMMAPIFGKLASEQTERLFAKVDTDANPLMSQRFNIRSIPTIIAFQNGHEINRLNGALPENQLKQWLTQTFQG